MVLKGAVIPNGCVVAAGSVVTKRFEEENSLIAGTPARVTRTGIEWE
jgi:acetyltransferase-like isoleucine patch superfamily enzyme